MKYIFLLSLLLRYPFTNFYVKIIQNLVLLLAFGFRGWEKTTRKQIKDLYEGDCDIKMIISRNARI